MVRGQVDESITNSVGLFLFIGSGGGVGFVPFSQSGTAFPDMTLAQPLILRFQFTVVSLEGGIPSYFQEYLIYWFVSCVWVVPGRRCCLHIYQGT